MEIEKAAEMGFCFGVRRALDLVARAARDRGPLQSLGSIVHNQQVVEGLARSGITIAESLDKLRGNTVIITSHGVSPQVIEEIKNRGLQMIDTTCPFVKKAQTTARGLAKAGYSVIIFGEANHPEVQGLLGWADGKGEAISEWPPLAEKLPRRLGVLSQTTQSPAHYTDFVKKITSSLGETSELRIFNTICEATRHRLAAALELARTVDLMIVVGGHNSANTQRLVEICLSQGVSTHHIETAAELSPAWLWEKCRVGVSAGASTPDQVIEEVVLKLEQMAKENL